MTRSHTEDTDYGGDGMQEEMHCIRCGAYLGAYGPGSNATVPCPKCREPNAINYNGEEFVVKRRKRIRASI